MAREDRYREISVMPRLRQNEDIEDSERPINTSALVMPYRLQASAPIKEDAVYGHA